MPQNCSFVLVEDVIKYFDEDIDGMGKHDGHPRNQGVPDSIRLWQRAELGELTEEEFMHLTVPDSKKPLIKDKLNMQFDADLDVFVNEKLKLLECGKDLHILIVRRMLPGENPNSSFYIEDGAHTAIALGVYFKSKPYKAVKAYIGVR